jgi:hypothetical protein
VSHVKVHFLLTTLLQLYPYYYGLHIIYFHALAE